MSVLPELNSRPSAWQPDVQPTELSVCDIMLHNSTLIFPVFRCNYIFIKCWEQAVGHNYRVEVLVLFKGIYSWGLKHLDYNSFIQNDCLHTQLTHCLVGGISPALYEIHFGSSSELSYVRPWRWPWLLFELKKSSRIPSGFEASVQSWERGHRLPSKPLFWPCISTRVSFLGR